MPQQDLQACIDACMRCAEACENCADACLGEQEVAKMVECIRIDRDCALMCFTAAALLSRGSQFARQFCGLCAEVCDTCAQECRKHDHDHCQQCADECERCAEECRQMVGVGAR